jgi:phosphoenolpyruvate carboxykinase (ATP)
VPSSFLDPRATWSDPAAYDRAARRLAEMFAENFADYAEGVADEIRAAGPIVSDPTSGG